MALRLALFLLLVGCTPQTSEQRTVRLVHDANRIEAMCGTHAGCAVIRGNECELIVPKPKDYLDHFGMEILGHELWHCFYGKNH